MLHYASHYGHFKVLEFLVDYLENNENCFEILNMQTLEGKTPLFCAILSCDIKHLQTKKDIIRLLFNTGKIDLALRKGSGEDLLDLAKRNSLYDFIVTDCLREDWAHKSTLKMELNSSTYSSGLKWLWHACTNRHFWERWDRIWDFWVALVWWKRVNGLSYSWQELPYDSIHH